MTDTSEMPENGWQKHIYHKRKLLQAGWQLETEDKANGAIDLWRCETCGTDYIHDWTGDIRATEQTVTIVTEA